MIKISANGDIANKIKGKLECCLEKYFSGDQTPECGGATTSSGEAPLNGDKKTQDLKFIRGETTKIMCPIEIAFTEPVLETTKTVQADLGTITSDGEPGPDSYYYEFRKDIKVTVEPRY